MADKEKKATKKVEDLLSEIEKLTVLELADLVKALEEKFGVSAAPVAMASATAPAGVPLSGTEEGRFFSKLSSSLLARS